MRPDGDERVRAAPAVHVREFDGELIILDLERGDYFGLDEIGARMWTELTAGRSPRQVAELLSREYDVEPAQLLSDVVSLVQELLDRGLLKRVVDEEGPG